MWCAALTAASLPGAAHFIVPMQRHGDMRRPAPFSYAWPKQMRQTASGGGSCGAAGRDVASAGSLAARSDVSS
eukprot:4259355-Prymnesium_polylepis.1